MVPLVRMPIPAVLSKNAEGWTEKYLALQTPDKKPRPRSSQYAHQDVVQTLAAMSHWKCFYCEQSVKDHHEVDHLVEVAERPDLAFDWGNLYLSCRDCNHKLPNTTIPVADCVDPCAPGCRPGDHLTFDGECIRPKGGSVTGSQTIKKFRLDRPALDGQRSRQLRLFDRTVTKLLERCRRDGGRSFNREEREILEAFCQQSQPFSLMFSCVVPEALQDLGR